MASVNETLVPELEPLVRWHRAITYAFNEAGQHSLYFVDSRLQNFELLVGEKMQVLSQQNIVFKLARGPQRNVEELSQFGVCPAAATFCNVCWNGEGSPSHLACQAKGFVPRKNACDVVHAHRKSMALLPHFQFGVVLHDCTREKPFSIFTYN